MTVQTSCHCGANVNGHNAVSIMVNRLGEEVTILFVCPECSSIVSMNFESLNKCLVSLAEDGVKGCPINLCEDCEPIQGVDTTQPITVAEIKNFVLNLELKGVERKALVG